MTKRKLQAIQTKQQLFDKAIELFKVKDYEDVTIAEICSYAEISVGSFYRYYRSKEDLIMESYLNFDFYVSNEFNPDSFKTRLDAIRHLIYMQTKGAEALGPTLFSQILRVQLKTEGKHVVEEDRAFHICIEKLIAEAIDNGELHTNYAPEEIAHLLLRLSRGVLYDWSIRKAPYGAYQRALEDVNLFLLTFK